MASPPDALGQLLWALGSAFCHQLPERSIFAGGMQLPFCARDTGTYLGFLVVAAVFFAGRRYRFGGLPDRSILALSIIGSILFVVDALSSYLGFRVTYNSLRLVSGLAFGAGVGFLLLCLLSILFFKGQRERKTFTLRDILPVYATLSLVGGVLLLIDVGSFGYYLVATSSAIGLIMLLFTVITVFIILAAGERMKWLRRMPTIVIVSILLEFLVIVVLYIARSFFAISPPM